MSYEEEMERTYQVLDMIDIAIFYPAESGKDMTVSNLMSQIDDYCTWHNDFDDLLNDDKDGFFEGNVFNHMDESDFIDYLKKRYGNGIGFHEVTMTYLK